MNFKSLAGLTLLFGHRECVDLLTAHARRDLLDANAQTAAMLAWQHGHDNGFYDESRTFMILTCDPDKLSRF